jgi:hypothetical protein
MTSLHPNTHLVNSENVQLGLNFTKHRALNAQLGDYAQFLTASLGSVASVTSRLIENDNDVYSLIEVVVRTRPKNRVWMEIQFYPDGMIVIQDNKFMEGYELNLNFPTAPIPVDDGMEYSNIEEVMRWLHGLDISDSLHRFVSARTLLREANDRVGA